MLQVDATVNRKRKSECDWHSFSHPTQRARYVNEAAEKEDDEDEDEEEEGESSDGE